MEEMSWSGVDNEVIDLSGNAYHGKSEGGASTISGGLIGRCCNFDNNRFTVSSAGAHGLQFGDYSFSISVWINTTDNSSGTHTLVNDKDEETFTDNLNVTDGQWHHIVVVRETTTNTVYLYIDGNQRFASTTSITDTLNTSESLSVGDTNGNDGPFIGKIDELSLWSNAIDLDKVLELYNSGNG